MGILSDVADLIDPDVVVERPELATPVTLAAHCDRTYAVRAHLEVIAAEMVALEAGEFDRLQINTAPQSGKTRTATEWGAFWWLCRHPTARIVIGSYGDDRAQAIGKHIRALVATYGAWYGLVLARGSTAVKDWDLTTGGGVRSVGVGSSITGFSADLILIDDPTKSRAEAESTVKRDATFDWYTADVLTRQQPGTKLMIVQTPWHVDDLRARVVKQEGLIENGGRWRVVIIPALCEDPATDPLNRMYGEPLPHPKIKQGDTARLMEHWEGIRAEQTPRDWRALYMCDPRAPEGQLATPELLRQRRCFETTSCGVPGRAGVSIDPSGGGRDVAGIIGGHLDDSKRCVFTHDFSGVMSADEWGRKACQMAVEIGAEFFVFEANYGGDMAAVVIRTAWDALRREDPEKYSVFVPLIKSVHSRKGKMLRAEPIGQQWKEDRCRTGKYLPDLESEWSTWTPGGESPGRIDASVHLAYELLPLPSSGSSSMAGAMTLGNTDLLGGRGAFGR